jgi:outer membrane protein assembly factor BamB
LVRCGRGRALFGAVLLLIGARPAPAIVVRPVDGVGDATVAGNAAGDVVMTAVQGGMTFVSVLAPDLGQRWEHPGGVAVVAPNGDVVVALPGDVAGDTVTIARLAAADGAERWRARVPARRIVVAADGDVIVAGTVDSTFDAVVVRLAGDAGIERWSYRFEPADSMSAGDVDLVVNALGDVFLSPVVDRAAPQDFLVAIDGATGVERWRRMVAVDTGRSFRAPPLAVEPSGDVAVASFDDRTALHVARVSASDGAIVWDSRTRFDPRGVLVLQLATDAAENVIAVGEIADAYAAGLDGASGALRWLANVAYGGGVTPMIGYAAVVGPGADVLVAGQLLHLTATCGDFAVARADGATGALISLDGVDGSATASNCMPFDCGGEPGPCPRHPRAGIDTDRASSVAIAGDGAIVAGGYLNDGRGRFDPAVVVFSDRLTGDRLVVRRGRLRLRSTDPHILAPLPDGPGDPGRFGGFVEVTDLGTGARREAPLRSGGWIVRRRHADGTATYRYSSARGTCTKAIVRDGALLELRCDARILGVSDAETAIRVTLGSGSHYCLEFGGSLVRDDGGEVERRDAPAPAACR